MLSEKHMNYEETKFVIKHRLLQVASEKENGRVFVEVVLLPSLYRMKKLKIKFFRIIIMKETCGDKVEKIMYQIKVFERK